MQGVVQCIQCGQYGHYSHMTCQATGPHLSHPYTITQTYLCPGEGYGVVLTMSGEELARLIAEKRSHIDDLETQLNTQETHLQRMMDEVRRRASASHARKEA